MICSDIWRRYHEWYFEFHEPLGEWNLRQFLNITSGIYAKYHVQIMLLFVYTTSRKRFVIFTCRYFKLSWNATALSQSNCSNFSCSSIKGETINQLERYNMHHGIGMIGSFTAGLSNKKCALQLVVKADLKPGYKQALLWTWSFIILFTCDCF